MTSRVLSAFFFISLVSSVAAADPTGLKVRITDKAQDVLKNLGVEFLQSLVNRPFADFDVPISISTTSIKGFKLTRLYVNPAHTAVHFHPNSALQFEIRNMDFSGELARSIHMHLLWKLHLDTRSVRFSGRGVNIKIEVKLKRNSQGQLKVNLPTCEVKADNIATTHTGITGLFWDALKPIYKWAFNSKLCPAVQEYILPKINTMLASISLTTNLHKGYDINFDYRLSNDVTVTSHYLDVPFKGEFFSGGKTVNLNSIKSRMDLVFSESNQMAFVGVSEFFFSSITMSLYMAGPFKFPVSMLDSVPEAVLASLGLSKKGPIKVKLLKVPTVRITKDGVSATVMAGAQSSANQADQNKILPVDCQLDIKVDIKGHRLLLNSESNAQCKLKPDTFRGKLVAAIANGILNNYLKTQLKSFTERLLIPLPEGVSFNEEKINYHNGFVVIGGDLNLTRTGIQKVVKGISR